jgi:hypothetical protein
MMSQTVRMARETIYVPDVAHSPVMWLVGLYKMDVTYCTTSGFWKEKALQSTVPFACIWS